MIMDQKSYQKMFDQIHLSAQRAGEVRRELAARRAQNKLEVTDMTDNSRNRKRRFRRRKPADKENIGKQPEKSAQND